MSENALQAQTLLGKVDCGDDRQLGSDCMKLYNQYSEVCATLRLKLTRAGRGKDELSQLRRRNTFNIHVSDGLSTGVAAILGRLRDQGYETPEIDRVIGSNSELMTFIGIMGANLGRSSHVDAKLLSLDCSRLVKSS